jgi:transcriptional regulator with XRE-family HTH domain
MKLGDKIRHYRKRQGLTQEQVAERLGVSTPAVNKWENDNSYPDITLLSPLARLLSTDLNTLLSFRENLTQQELGGIIDSVKAAFDRQGFAFGFEKGEIYLREYPNDKKLAFYMGRLYAGYLVLLDREDREFYENRILELMEQAGESEEQKTAEAALSWRMHFYAEHGDFEKAEEVLRQIPETSVDKEELQVSLECQKGDFKKAEEYCMSLLAQKIKGVENALKQYHRILLETGETEQADEMAEVYQRTVSFFKRYYDPKEDNILR